MPKQTLDLLMNSDLALEDAIKKRVAAVRAQRSPLRLSQLWPFAGVSATLLAPLVEAMVIAPHEAVPHVDRTSPPLAPSSVAHHPWSLTTVW
jgi:hypothetical protein